MTEPSTMATRTGAVALLMPNFEAGGAERVMIRLAGGLAEQGYPVDLLVLSDHGPYRDEVDPRVNVVSLHANRAWRAIPGLTAYLRERQPVALLSALFHMNFIAVIARGLTRRPTRTVISEHNTQELVHSSVGPLRWIAYSVLLRWSYPRADAVACVSGGIADGLARAMPVLRNRLSVIGNPIATPELLQLSRAPVDHPWLVPGQPPVVLAAGRLIPAKGFDVLIQAFARVVSCSQARLVILGEGPERRALAAQIEQLGLSDHVALAGFSKNPYAWMSRAAVFVLSSRHEGLPGALIEAMACGCRVVSTDCPYGPSEILEDGRWGRLVPVDDVTALAAAISEALTTPDAPDVRIRAEHYSLDHAVRAYRNLLQLPAPLR